MDPNEEQIDDLSGYIQPDATEEQQPEEKPAAVVLDDDSLNRLADVLDARSAARNYVRQIPVETAPPVEEEDDTLVYTDPKAYKAKLVEEVKAQLEAQFNPVREQSARGVKQRAIQEVREQFGAVLPVESLAELERSISEIPADQIGILEEGSHLMVAKAKAFEAMQSGNAQVKSAPKLSPMERGDNTPSALEIPASFAQAASQEFQRMTGRKPTRDELKEMYSEHTY